MWSEVDEKLSPAEQKVFENLEIKNEDGFRFVPKKFVNIFPFERLQLYAKTFEIENFKYVFGAICDDEIGEEIEILVFLDKAGRAHFVFGVCQILYEQIPPIKCVEFSFEEEPDKFYLAQISEFALKDFRDKKFKTWKEAVEFPQCQAAFRRLLQIGPINRVYDFNIFPTPEDFKANFVVKDPSTGKDVFLPHQVHKMRMFDLKENSYRFLDCHLKGAPSDEEREVFWEGMLNKFKDQMGKEFIDRILAGERIEE